MGKLVITNSENNRLAVDLIRYFKFKNNQYLIYTMNEFDEKNYLKLYLVIIMEELGVPVAQTISDDSEWSEMQNIIKRVLKEIRSGKKKNLSDLDYSSLEGIKIVNPRHFKLDAKLVELLSSDYSFGNFESENSNQDQIEGTSIINTEMSNNNFESIPNVSSLEPIEETLAKEGNFEPKNLNGINENPLQNIEIISNDEIVKTNDMVKNIIADNSQENNIAENFNTNHVQISESVSFNDNKIKDDEEVNYKELYMATKEQNEASIELINGLMLQLALYKERFGELDA